jgi:hypothetical protein
MTFARLFIISSIFYLILSALAAFMMVRFLVGSSATPSPASSGTLTQQMDTSPK